MTTNDGMRPLVVVPALNEESTISAVIANIDRDAPTCDVLVVDDGSTDRTADVARSAGAKVIQLPFNLGVGGAMRAGFRFAQEHGYDAVVQVDADGQHPTNRIPDLLAALNHADVVVGARFAGDGSYAASPLRRSVMWGLSRVLTSWSGESLTDTTSGFRASSSRAIALYSRYYPVEYLGDTVESLVMAIRARLKVQQVPVSMMPRQGGEPSQDSWKSGVYAMRAILVLFTSRMRKWPQIPEEDAGGRHETIR